MTGEKQLHEQVIAYLKKHGYQWFRSRMDQRTSTACGDPDFIIVRDDRVAFIEMKLPKGRVSPTQMKRFAELEQAGCKIKVARSAESAIRYIETVWDTNAATEAPVKPQPAPEPKFWITDSRDLGTIVVTRDMQGELDWIRVASAFDQINLPRLPWGSV